MFESRLERYKDFTERHQVDGQYSWESGLEGLLSVLTPDSKAISLYSMPPQRVFFDSLQMSGNVLDYIENLGVSRSFPVSHRGVWAYCYNPQLLHLEGSLVSIGALVKELNYPTSEGEKTAYYISEAGNDLAKPLVVSAAEWVSWAGKSKISHKHDSMWKVLSGINSKEGARRQLSLYRLVEFLVQNPGDHRVEDVDTALRDKIGKGSTSRVITSLGKTGVIDYESPYKEMEGISPRGFVTYKVKHLMDFEQVLEQMGLLGIKFEAKGYIRSAINYAEANQDNTLELNELSKRLKISQLHASRVLLMLHRVGVLDRESGFSRYVRTKTRANELTRGFYEMVLLPTKETAYSLLPAHSRILTANLCAEFLQNFAEERSQIGPAGGEQVRAAALEIINNNDQVDLYRICKEGNQIINRDLTNRAWAHQIEHLIKDGSVIKIGRRRIYKKTDN